MKYSSPYLETGGLDCGHILLFLLDGLNWLLGDFYHTGSTPPRVSTVAETTRQDVWSGGQLYAYIAQRVRGFSLLLLLFVCVFDCLFLFFVLFCFCFCFYLIFFFFKLLSPIWFFRGAFQFQILKLLNETCLVFFFFFFGGGVLYIM